MLATAFLLLLQAHAGHPISASDTSWPNRTPDPILSGLIHAWQLNEGGTNTLSYDRVGSTDLTMHNSPTWTTNDTNIGVTFSAASTQWMDSPAWLVGETTNFTVAAWFFYASVPNSMMLLTKENVNATWQIYFTGGVLAPVVWDTGGNSGGWQTSPPATNAWHQAVITFKTATTQNAYVDNAAIGGFTGAFSDVADHNTVLSVGRYAAFGGGFYLDGTMGPIYVWNRALSTNEISQLYTNRYLFP